MDTTCAWLQTIVGWVERAPHAPIHFAGTGSTFGNVPAAFLEIFYLVEGSIRELAMGSLRTSVNRGQVGIVNVHFGNVAAANDRFRGWCVFLDVADEPRFDVLRRAPLALIADVRHPSRVDAAFAHLVEQCRGAPWLRPQYYPTPIGKPGPGDFARKTLLKASLLELLGVLLEESTEEEALGPSATIPPALNDAVNLLHLRYDQPNLSRAQLARAAHMHPDHFGRVFQRHFNLSPMQYLTRVRVAQACFLLQHTTQTIGAIAREVGILDPYHFSRLFRVHMGQSPRDYRRSPAHRRRSVRRE